MQPSAATLKDTRLLLSLSQGLSLFRATMPPAKARPHDPDARSDASAKEKHPTTSHTSHARGRRAGGGAALTNGSHLKEVISASADATSSANRNGGQPAHTGSSGGISWVSEDLSLLQEYRASHRLEAPSAFKNPLGHAILGSGIGKYSPTMARKKNERRISKEQLATAVRKNFNALAVSESEVIVDLLYKVKMQDKTFRMRFPPPRTR
ncbi:putative mitochondrial chaperone [Neofusicoccum parvum]|nr:putative mitochondrial chaperone [Neofusicoccum parvum]